MKRLELSFVDSFEFQDEEETGLTITGIAFATENGIVESKRVRVTPHAFSNIARTMSGVNLMVDHSKSVARARTS